MEHTDKSILTYVKPHSAEAALCVTIKFIGTMCDLFIPYILAYIIDKVIPTGQVNSVIVWGLVMALCAVGALVGNIIANQMAASVAKKSTESLRNDLFRSIVYLKSARFDYYSVPSLTLRSTSDTYNMQAVISRLLKAGIRAPILMLGGVILMATMDPKLTLLMVVFLPVLFAIVFTISVVGRKRFERVQRSTDNLIRVTRENVTGVRVIRALDKQDYESSRFDTVSREVTSGEQRASRLMSLTRPTANILMNLGLCAVVLFGAYRVNLGETGVGTIIAFLTYFSIMLNATIFLTTTITMLSRATASARRILEVVNDKEYETSVPYNTPECDELSTALEFSSVNFSYPEGATVLKDVSFSVSGGETVGIIGGTASGKTTILSLLLRFYEIDSGEIRVFGKKLDDYAFSELRSDFGVCFQNEELYKGTVRDNVRIYRELSDEDVIIALKAAQIYDFVMQSGGLDFNILSLGRNLSGGQKQRILLARALAGKPRILMLDDSMSALDFATESRVRRDLALYYPDSTRLIIAQRLSSVMQADKIIVLSGGEVVGIGTSAELLNSCTEYRAIYDLQVGGERGEK